MTYGAKQLDELKRALDSRHQELLAEVRADVSRARGDTDNGLPGEVRDAADRASAAQAVGIDLAELLIDLDQLSLIQAARARLERGEFGRCAGCGKDIPYERLRAQPMAVRCVDCQRAIESTTAEKRSDPSH